MAKNKKSRAKHMPQQREQVAAVSATPLMLGSFRVPDFDGPSAVFGAKMAEYPPMASIPKVEPKFSHAFSALFFRGGTLAEHGLKLKSGIDHRAAMTAIRAWMCSFDPKHEHKEATVAWASPSGARQHEPSRDRPTGTNPPR